MEDEETVETFLVDPTGIRKCVWLAEGPRTFLCVLGEEYVHGYV